MLAAMPVNAGSIRFEFAGNVVVIPEIADFEVRRELIRRGAHTGLIRLDSLAEPIGL